MTTAEMIADLKIEIAHLEAEPCDEYWPEWEKARDLEQKRDELNRLLAK